MAKTKAPFGYYGGKYAHLKWILPLLSNDCRTYVEPFCGSCAVLLNRPRARVEVANDIDGLLYNFWKVLRSKDGPELIRQIELTPNHEMEFLEARANEGSGDDPIERARSFWIRVNLAFNGQVSFTNANFAVKPQMQVKSMTSHRKRLEVIRKRIGGVQWTCRDGVRLCQNVDRPFTMIYADPPYEEGVRCPRPGRQFKGYRHDSNDDLHNHLVDWARESVARVAISHYPSSTYDALEGWWRVSKRVLKSSSNVATGKPKSAGIEALYLNYTPRNLKALGKSLDLEITRLGKNKG